MTVTLTHEALNYESARPLIIVNAKGKLVEVRLGDGAVVEDVMILGGAPLPPLKDFPENPRRLTERNKLTEHLDDQFA